MKRIPILLLFSILTAALCSAKIIKLTTSLLEQATKITYCRSNGSVAPDFQWHCYAVVTPTSVKLMVYQAGEVTYDETATISSTKYTKFINHIAQQQIYYNDKDYDDFDFPVGTGTNSITVVTGDSVIFAGDTWEILKVDNGYLSDAFMQVMPGYMKQEFAKFAKSPISTDSDEDSENAQNTDSIVDSIIDKLHRSSY